MWVQKRKFFGMAQTVFRVAIIGLGYISKTHLDNFDKIAGVEIAAICDVSDIRVRECARVYDVKHVFLDYRELLGLHNLDLVVICVPNNLHERVTIDALNAGQNVLCEKPMATNLKGAHAMLAAAERNKKKLSVAMNFRWQFFSPEVFHIKRLIETGELGKIYYIRLHYLRRETFPLDASWSRWNLSEQQSGGGVLIDLGPHMLDLAMWLVNDFSPTLVNGFVHNGLLKYAQLEDFAAGSVRLESGVRIQLDLAWNSLNETARSIQIYGEKGGYLLDALKPEGHRLSKYTADSKESCLEPLASRLSHPQEITLQEHIVKRLRAGQNTDCSADRALEVMRIIEGWYESSKTGRDHLFHN